jgi:hypothetical protein
MASIPIASFLAGSLITLLIPVGLLIALTVWYFRAATRVPYDPAEKASAAVPDEPSSGETPGASA